MASVNLNSLAEDIPIGGVEGDTDLWTLKSMSRRMEPYIYRGDIRRIDMVKTTVIIDDKLLDEAMRASGAKTKKQAISEGLKELIRKKKLEALRQELGTFDLVITLDELEKLRNGQ